jgi:hypothetical protein
MKYILLTIAFLGGMALSAHSQSVKGKLLDLVDSRPLAGATLTLTSVKDSLQVKNAVSDSTGRFQFSDLPIDSFFVRVSIFPLAS